VFPAGVARQARYGWQTERDAGGWISGRHRGAQGGIRRGGGISLS